MSWNAPQIRTLAQAKAYLDAGRNPEYRRIERNTHVVQTERGYGIRFHKTVVVEFLPNGRMVLNTGGHESITTKARINQFSGVYPGRIYKRVKAQPDGWVIHHASDPCLPAKLRLCRTCKGTGKEAWTCRGVTWVDVEYAYGGELVDGQLFECLTEPVAAPCEHGKTAAHKVPSTCYRCDGKGQADYGSQTMPTKFVDGIVVNRKGKVVGQMSPPVTHAHIPVKTETGWYNPEFSSYSDKPFYGYDSYGTPIESDSTNDIGGGTVKSGLRKLLPAASLNAKLTCPAPGCKADRTGVMDSVMHLNDTHRWTREQIADWLDTLPLDLAFNAA